MSGVGPHLSVGRIDALQTLIELLARFEILQDSVLRQMLAARGEMGGSFPHQDALAAALDSGLADRTQDRLSLAASGRAVAALLESGAIVEARRVLLARQIEHRRRDLLAAAHMALSELETFTHGDFYQCLEDMQLVHEPLSESATAWWARLRSSADNADDEYLKALGDHAEERSLSYEKRRLAESGRLDLASSIVWVSRLDEGTGFDILSFLGPNDGGLPVDTRLRIEVKACGRRGPALHFFLSRNEWDVSRSADIPYQIQLWRVLDVNEQSSAPSVILDAETLNDWVPHDSEPTGFWMEARIELDERALSGVAPLGQTSR